jgi:trehalose/maltose hydrolase-like predicted phosphorylase
MELIPEPTSDPGWILESEGYDPLRERSIESRFAVSNGFLGIRGGRSTTRGARWVVPARTYVAGLFDRPGTDNAVPALVPAADWLTVHILLSGEPLVHHPSDVSLHRMTLDMKRGVLITRGRHSTSAGLKGQVRTLRLVSQTERTVGLQLIQFEIDEGTVEVTFQASFEGTDIGLIVDEIEQDHGIWRTQHSGKRLAMAAVPSLQVDGKDLPATEPGPLKWSWTWHARPGQVVSFERIVAIVRSDSPASDPGIDARRIRDRVRQDGWRRLVTAHETAWASRWQSSDIVVDGDAAAQVALRFAIYHLISAANPADEHVSIGARALTGDQYLGHVFWDTEIFLLPFYILTWPEAARTMLMYRFHTLDAAREKAARMGWRGALYAWESADTGEETTPDQVIAPDLRVVDVLCGKLEQHISADVAYAVWQYWQATGDDTFLCEAGAEIILEIARFWSSRARLEADGYSHIRNVIGPDEYHEHIDDNAYTNVLARWTIRRALDVAAWLQAHRPALWIGLSGRLGLDDAELAQWLSVAQTMATGLDPETELYAQFSGYFALEDINLSDYAGRSAPMDMVLGRERTQRTQVVKQADVVALLALLPEEFPPGADVRNFRYYEPRCSHGSSLSPAMHGMVAARLGDAEMGLRYFMQTAAIDLAESYATVDGGVHIAALGGMWMLVVFGFAGLSMQPDGLAIEPHLPAGWRSLTFAVQWRGRRIRIRIDQDGPCLEAMLEAGEAMTLTVKGARHALDREQVLRVGLAGP